MGVGVRVGLHLGALEPVALGEQRGGGAVPCAQGSVARRDGLLALGEHANVVAHGLFEGLVLLGGLVRVIRVRVRVRVRVGVGVRLRLRVRLRVGVGVRVRVTLTRTLSLILACSV